MRKLWERDFNWVVTLHLQNMLFKSLFVEWVYAKQWLGHEVFGYPGMLFTVRKASGQEVTLKDNKFNKGYA